MPDNPSDIELWERAAAHDGPAFGQLFERHSQAVYNHCSRRTASWSSAEDLTSIVWAEVWRRRKDVRLDGESILPWLLAVANNCLRNFQRLQRRYRKFLMKLPPATIDDFAEETISRLDDERRMAEVLSVLAPTTTVHPVPNLVVCTMPDGTAGVFPGTASTCTNLGLAEPKPSTTTP